MKSMIRTLGLVAAVATIAVLAAPAAEASCPLPKTFSSYSGGLFSYVNVPAGTTAEDLVGRFWQTNDPTQNSGTLPLNAWLKFDAAYGVWYISGVLSDPGVVGCPSGQMTVLIQSTEGGAFFHARTANEVALDFNYQTGGDLNLVPVPRPTVLASQRNGTTVDLQVQVANGDSGVSGVSVPLTYQIVSASSQTDPGRDAAAYTAGPTVAPGTPVAFPADCTTATSDQWVATRLIVGGVPTDIVSAPTRVNCNPALADPKFKNIDRPTRPSPRRDR